MRPSVLLMLLCLLCFARAAYAGYWELHIYSDTALTETSINDDTPRIVNFYVVEKGSFQGATGARFAVEPGPGFTGVWLSDTTTHFKVGSSPTDVSVAYAACIPPPILVLTMSYQLFGTSSPCSELRIVPPDHFQCAISSDMDCLFVEACITDLRTLTANCPVPTQPSTWGRVKALYR